MTVFDCLKRKKLFETTKSLFETTFLCEMHVLKDSDIVRVTYSTSQDNQFLRRCFDCPNGF